MANKKALKLSGFKFQPFSKKQIKVLTWANENAPTKDKFILVADGSVRSGKAQSLDSIIYTPTGKKRMGDIQVGDYVFNRHGKPIEVLGVYPQGLKDIYTVEFHDGSKSYFCKEHLFSYRTRNGSGLYTATLGEIMDDLSNIQDRETMSMRAGKYRFPLCGCIEFKQQEIKYDAYFIGLLLGDGTLSGNNIVFTNNNKELHQYMKNHVPDYTFHPAQTRKRAYGVFRCEDKWLINLLSNKRAVPNEYKYNSVENRLKLLAGLMNTGGLVWLKNTIYILYHTKAEQLRDDVIELARSLGMFVNGLCKNKMRMNGKSYYLTRFTVSPELAELLLDKFRAKLNLLRLDEERHRLIKSITFRGREPAQCIMVNDEEQLYLTDNFIVTHNTVVCSLSFILHTMSAFNGMNFAICGKSSGAVRRNVVNVLKQMLLTLGYECVDHRADNYLEITKGKTTNLYFIFGGRIFATLYWKLYRKQIRKIGRTL